MMVPATVAGTKAGIKLVADGGFTCLVKGEVCEVRESVNGLLYVGCKDGRHYLDGQLNVRDEYVGFSIVEERS